MSELSGLSLLDFQVEPAHLIAERLNPEYKRGILLVQPAGTGKTYEAVQGLWEAFKLAYFDLPDANPLQPFKVLIFTTAKVCIQFSRVLLEAGIKDVMVTSHASSLASFGDGMLNWIPTGDTDMDPVWDDDFKPSVIIVDESQKCMNHTSGFAKVIIAAIKQGIKVMLMSATPYTRLSETYVTCLALNLCHASVHAHKQFCSAFADTGYYNDWNAAAMRRFDDYLIERGLKIMAKDIKFAHRVFNKCRLIDFESEEHRELYRLAYEEYLEECRKHNRRTPQGVRAIWVAMVKFRKKAENLRSGQLCKVAIEVCTTQKKQVIIASNFTSTLEIVYAMLTEIHHIPKGRIGMIVGGRDCQSDIDKFQEGDIDYMLLSLKSGGAGLSLHHDRKNGKARPRYCILPPTWSAIELVQVLGRAHRITSISTTYQDVIWYKDTIEERVAARVERKMKSLKEAVTKREVWTDLFSDEDRDAEELDELKKIVEEEEVDKDEDGLSIIDSMPLDALDNAIVKEERPEVEGD